MQLSHSRKLGMNLTALFALACFFLTRITEAQVPVKESVTNVQSNALSGTARTSAIPHVQQIGVIRSAAVVALRPDTASGGPSTSKVEKVIPYFGLLVIPFALFIAYKLVKVSARL